MSDFGEHCTHVARKEHRCASCYKPIIAGEKYTRYVGMFESDWQNWAAHEICLEVVNQNRNYDDYLEQLSWCELVQSISTLDLLTRFLERFPPDDDEDSYEAMYKQYAYIEHRRLAV